MTEAQERSDPVGCIIAGDAVNAILLDIVHRLDSTIAGDEEFKAEFTEATDGMLVDGLLD